VFKRLRNDTTSTYYLLAAFAPLFATKLTGYLLNIIIFYDKLLANFEKKLDITDVTIPDTVFSFSRYFDQSDNFNTACAKTEGVFSGGGQIN